MDGVIAHEGDWLRALAANGLVKDAVLIADCNNKRSLQFCPMIMMDKDARELDTKNGAQASPNN